MKTTFDAALTLTTTWQIIPQNGELLKVSFKQKLLFIENAYLLVFIFPQVNTWLNYIVLHLYNLYSGKFKYFSHLCHVPAVVLSKKYPRLTFI